MTLQQKEEAGTLANTIDEARESLIQIPNKNNP